MTPVPLYGILAEYPDAAALKAAARELTARGYRDVDGFTPFPVEGLAEALGFRRTRLPLLVLIGGIFGCATGFGLQWWVSVVAYPLNIGGRPPNSLPAFMPVTFELTILAAALAAVLGMLALNGLPRPHHPLFGIDAFSRANTAGYFLCVAASDPRFNAAELRAMLHELRALQTWDVPDVR